MTNTEWASAATLAKPDKAGQDASPRDISLFLSRLSVGQKLLLSSALVGVPLLGVSATLGSLYYGTYQQARHQTQAAAPIADMEALQQALLTLRGSDSAVPTEALKSAKAQTDNLLNSVKATGISDAVTLAQSVKTKTESLVNSVETKTLDPVQTGDQITELLNNDLSSLFSTLSRKGDLPGVPGADARDLAKLSSETMPQLLPKLSTLMANLTQNINDARSLNKGNLTPAQVSNLETQFVNADNLIQEFSAATQNVTDEYPALKAKLDDLYAQALTDVNSAFSVARSGSSETGRVTVSAAQLSDVSSTARTSLYKAYATTIASMNTAFHAQEQQALNKLLLLLAILAALIVGVFLLLGRIIRNITQPLGELTLASQQLAQGQLDVQVPVRSYDELGTLGHSFNSAATQLRASAERNEQERQEGLKLQRNVGEFLDVTMDIADGDLTKRGKVTEDVLGNVVDSINLMVEELGGTLRGVQRASESVTGGSRAMLHSTAEIEQGALVTAEQARRVNEQAQDINLRIQEMARIAQTSADTARLALSASQQGQDAVSSTLQDMQSIRESSQQVAERVQSLSQRSEQIQEIVDSMSHIASQTNLLSLHASIEAAGAGEAGGRFAIVAEEVRQLADESSGAASRIAALIASIQAEIREVNASMKANAVQVEEGYKVAGTAGERLRQIGALSEQSAQLAQDISDAASAQVSGMQNMGQSAQQIAEVAEQSQQSVEQGRSAAEQLQTLAQQLSQSLSRFQLPN